ncbi:MAG: hypothetical protein HQL46_00875 [Gammaproteobacteria bacterium]|nr:hypothetical protein [Gammaproteobacteria bacterium]
MTKEIDKFLTNLRKQQHTETIYNPYRQYNLTHNLRQYLNHMFNLSGNRIVLVGEALGYKCGKLTG